MGEHLSGVYRGIQDIQRGKGRSRDSAIGRECPATILIAEEAAESICGVPDGLKWNLAF